jgi:HEAT repeat protein
MGTTNSRDDPRTVAELVRAALQSADEDEAWRAVRALHWRGSREVLEAALALCLSASPRERAWGADILGQIGVEERAFPEECFRAVDRLLREDAAPEVLAAAAHAMGYLGDARGVPALARLAGHPREDVRLGVARALGGRDEPEAVATLLGLTGDADGDVRDWATFGLGSLGSLGEADGAAVREALLRRLGDPHGDTHFEAVCGLARRRDERAVPPLVELLRSDPDNLCLREAAHGLLGGGRDGWPTGELLERLERPSGTTAGRT